MGPNKMLEFVPEAWSICFSKTQSDRINSLASFSSSTLGVFECLCASSVEQTLSFETIDRFYNNFELDLIVPPSSIIVIIIQIAADTTSCYHQFNEIAITYV